MTPLPPIPDGWTWAPLGEIADVVGGVTKDTKKQSDPKLPLVPYLRVANVQRGRIDVTSVAEIRVPEATVRRLQLQPGDVLLNEGGDRDKLGRGWVWEGQIPNCIHQNHVFRARIRNKILHPKLLAWFTNECAKGWFEKHGKQTTNLASISLSMIKQLPVPIPPVAEQKRLLNLLEDHLSRLDSVLATCAVTTLRLARLRQAELNAKFGLTDDSIALGDLLVGIQAGRSVGGSAPPAGENEWGIVKVSAMTWGEFRPQENKAIPESLVNPNFEIMPGDLLVSRANTSEYVGAPVLVGETRRRLLLSDKSLRLMPRNDVDPEWLWRALQAPSARRQISAAATGTKDSMRNISQKLLMGIRLPRVEPDAQRWLAKAYAERDSELKRIERAAKAGALRVEALRRAVLNAAYSGALNDKIEELAGV
ncbi:restriction endonuclease subunit S [Haloechinothrix salitolerans]|uniref:Restriction endonuclease subunit S n=1 Tax=Haloechinothrix salitolerans TaxID=926830 RepID=A0ABW2BY78_9PSEU